MKQLSSFALAALSRAEIDGNTIRIKEQLDRKLYIEVNKVLESLGGDWNRKLKAHVFYRKDDLRGVINSVLKAQGYVDKKKELQQFFTPAAIADLLVRLAKLRTGSRGSTVLEPSAGIGHILDAIDRVDPAYHPPVTAFEIDGENVNALRRIFWLTALAQVDFLKVLPAPDQLFDRIIMNPPFAEHADVKHVMHAWKFLASGGRLVAVMSNHVTFADDNVCREFREFVTLHSVARDIALPNMQLRYLNKYTFIELPVKAFAESGTNVSTVVVVLEKP